MNENNVTKETKHSKVFTCKRLRLLSYLLDRGFEPTTTIPNPDNYKFKYWLFDNTPELEEVITEYFAKIRKNK